MTRADPEGASLGEDVIWSRLGCCAACVNKDLYAFLKSGTVASHR